MVVKPTKGPEFSEEPIQNTDFAAEMREERRFGCGPTGAEVEEEQEDFLFRRFMHIWIISDH